MDKVQLVKYHWVPAGTLSSTPIGVPGPQFGNHCVIEIRQQLIPFVGYNNISIFDKSQYHNHFKLMIKRQRQFIVANVKHSRECVLILNPYQRYLCVFMSPISCHPTLSLEPPGS